MVAVVLVACSEWVQSCWLCMHLVGVLVIAWRKLIFVGTEAYHGHLITGSGCQHAQWTGLPVGQCFTSLLFICSRVTWSWDVIWINGSNEQAWRWVSALPAHCSAKLITSKPSRGNCAGGLDAKSWSLGQTTKRRVYKVAVLEPRHQRKRLVFMYKSSNCNFNLVYLVAEILAYVAFRT